MTQVFLEAMEGCHLYLSPFFVIQTGTFWVRTSTFVLINIGYERRKMAATLIPSAVVSCLLMGPSGSFDCFRGVHAPTLQCCSFSSGPQSEFILPVGFMSAFGSSSFSHRSRAVLFPECFLLQFCKLPPLR